MKITTTKLSIVTDPFWLAYNGCSSVVKHRASEIKNLIEDHVRLRTERKSMQNLRAKMNGVSNECSKKTDKSLAIKSNDSAVCCLNCRVDN